MKYQLPENMVITYQRTDDIMSFMLKTLTDEHISTLVGVIISRLTMQMEV